VASFATTTACWPAMVPMPVIMPAPGASSS
jgi:hypothetical protein